MIEQNSRPSAILTDSAPATPPAESAPEATPAPDLAAVSEAEFRSQMEHPFTPDQLRALADGEVAAGRLTREQADAALAADGVTTEKPAPATVAIEGFPAAQPHEYLLPNLVGEGDYTPAVAAFDKQARTWLSTAGFTREIGSAIAAEIAKVSAATRDMDGTTRELYRRTEAVKLQRLWSDEKTYARRVALAQKLVAEIETKAPGLAAVLENTGAGDSAAVIAHIALHAERLYKTKYPGGLIWARQHQS